MADFMTEFSNQPVTNGLIAPENNDISQRMRVPDRITVNENTGVSLDEKPSAFQPIQNSNVRGTKQRAMAGMKVPERIVLDGDDNGGYSKLAKELKEEMVNSTFPVEMSTPPRTLTVDERTTVYSHNNSPTRKVAEPSIRNSFSMDDRAMNNDGAWSRDLDLMADMHHSDSDDINLVVDEVTDLRKSVVKLNKKVLSLEKQLNENKSWGFLVQTLLYAFTLINPILVHWFLGRRR